MADTKLTGLAALSAVPDDADYVYIVDVSDTSMAASGTSKKNLAKYFIRSNGTANTLGASIAANSNSITGIANLSIGGTATPAPLTVDGAARIRQSGTVRYRSEWVIVGGISNINAYDDTGAAYIPLYVDGSPVRLRVGSSSTDYAELNSSGDWVINDGNLTITNGRAGEAWSNVSFNTGWGNFGGIYRTGQYKKLGDLVFLRGFVKRSSGSSTTMFTLPSGYRPSQQEILTSSSADAWCRVDIETDGDVVIFTGGDPTNWVSLNGLVFSTA